MNSTKEEIEEIRAQLPEEWKYLVDTPPDNPLYKTLTVNDKFDLESVIGYMELRLNHLHFNF
jgi:hypothetical protein